MEDALLQAPGHGDVRQGIGGELEATKRGIGAEEHNGGTSGLWENFEGGVGVQIPWEGAHIFR